MELKLQIWLWPLQKQMQRKLTNCILFALNADEADDGQNRQREFILPQDFGLQAVVYPDFLYISTCIFQTKQFEKVDSVQPLSSISLGYSLNSFI